MRKIVWLATVLFMTACVDQAVDSSTTEQNLCNINPDTCPGFPVGLKADTVSAADDWTRTNYPGTSYNKTGVHCTYGPAVSSCNLHIHITPNVAVDFSCGSQNNGQGFNCDFDITVE